MSTNQNQVNAVSIQESTDAQPDEELGVTFARLRRENPAAFRWAIFGLFAVISFLCWLGRHQAWGV